MAKTTSIYSPKRNGFNLRASGFDFLILVGKLLLGHVLVELFGNSENSTERLAVGKVVVDSDDLLVQVFGLLGLVVQVKNRVTPFMSSL